MSQKQTDVPIKRLTSFKQTGHIGALITIETPEDLDQLPDTFSMIGGGSNILINPSIKHPIIRVSPQFIEPKIMRNQFVCSAGMPLANALKIMAQHELTGLEFATGVPATIGGMVYMNFECWGYQMADYVCELLVYDEQGMRWIPQSSYESGYRWTSFHNTHTIILGVKLNLNMAKQDDIKNKMAEYLKKRKEKQPLFKHTFGSVFKNPLPQKAGQLIDQLGLKGVSVGGVTVSNTHANFFENDGQSGFDDAIVLIELIQEKVKKMYNIKLECEVQRIQ